jgi:hypothetical protein
MGLKGNYSGLSATEVMVPTFSRPTHFFSSAQTSGKYAPFRPPRTEARKKKKKHK